MITWHETPQRDHAGVLLSVSYKAQIPHWGTASVHPHIHHPGEMFLDCPALGIRMHPLGQVFATDALGSAETALIQTMAQHGIWCLEAITAFSESETTTVKISQE